MINPWIVRAMANIFIVLFVCRAIIMCWPFDQNCNPKRFLQPLDQLSCALGVTSQLNLFSPSPPKFIHFVKFVVIFDDKSSAECSFLRDKMAPWDSDHSYRQYVRNTLFWNGDIQLVKVRRYLARYMARHATSPSKRPVRIDFLQCFMLELPPDQGIGKPLIQPQEYQTFYSYTVRPGDLD